MNIDGIGVLDISEIRNSWIDIEIRKKIKIRIE